MTKATNVTNTFVNPVLNPNVKLGVNLFVETEPVYLWSDPSPSEVDAVIRAVYRQVLGNAHVMDSERLVASESQLRRRTLSVREFVRQVATSELYRSLFFEPCSRIRSIELNFKHLLGRAPEGYEEIAEHSHYLDQGFDREINAYLDSDEYMTVFGEDTVPYYRGYKTQAGRKMVGFTHLFQLLRGSTSSDKDPRHRNRSRLTTSLLRNRPSPVASVTGAPPVYGLISWQAFESTSKPISLGSFAPAERADVTLKQKLQAQALEIEQLQSQLSALRPLAALGSAYLKKDWQPGIPISLPETASLPQQLDLQAIQIRALQDAIADAQRYAMVGEMRMRKWQNRNFTAG
jgi:phycoerythrin-associated linker protein